MLSKTALRKKAIKIAKEILRCEGMIKMHTKRIRLRLDPAFVIKDFKARIVTEEKTIDRLIKRLGLLAGKF